MNTRWPERVTDAFVLLIAVAVVVLVGASILLTTDRPPKPFATLLLPGCWYRRAGPDVLMECPEAWVESSRAGGIAVATEPTCTLQCTSRQAHENYVVRSYRIDNAATSGILKAP